MAKCHSCRDKDVELLTWWERTRYWLFVKVNSILFTQDFEDLKSEKYTQGFSDGFVDGTEKERTSHERMRELYTPEKPTESIEDRVTSRLNELLTVVDPRKVVALDKKNGRILIGGQPADERLLSNLKSESEAILGMEIWQLLYETPKALAERAMFVEGESLDAMQKGRTMLYTLSTQKKILDILKSYKGVDKP